MFILPCAKLEEVRQRIESENIACKNSGVRALVINHSGVTLSLIYTDPEDPDICMVEGRWADSFFRSKQQCQLHEIIENAVLASGGIDFVDHEIESGDKGQG